MSKEYFRETIQIDQFAQPKTVSRFIGCKGNSLTSFEKALNVKAVVISADGNVFLRTSGNRDNVDKSMFKFYGAIADLEDSLQLYELEVPNSKVGFLIGAHGWSVNEIMRLSGSKVFCKPGVGDMSIFVIEGSYTMISAAVELILRRLERFDRINQIEDENYVSNLSRRVASGEDSY